MISRIMYSKKSWRSGDRQRHSRHGWSSD